MEISSPPTCGFLMGIYCDPLIESQNEAGLGPHLLEFSQKNELVVGSPSATLHDPPWELMMHLWVGTKL